jgi:capsular polysaccharide biosynthesis protein/Mrp family chromosome partitioning ATPase
MLLLAAVAAGLAAYVTAAREKPSYDAKAVLLVGPLSTEIDTLRASGQQALLYAQLATSRKLLDQTAAKLKLPDVGSHITATASDVTRLLTITARYPNAVQAANIANAHAIEVIALAADRKPRPGGPGVVQMVDPATPQKAAVGPGAALIALLAALAGFGGALALALLLDRSSESVSGSADLKALTGVGFLGALDRGAARRDPTGRTILEAAPDSRGAEQFRLMAAKLVAMGPRSILILSMEDDADVVATNLAAALGASGTRVAVLDADDGEPVHADGAGRRSRNGSKAEEAEDILTGTVQVLARPSARTASPGSAVDRARRLLTDLSADHELVVVHARPLGRSVSGLVWGRVTDGTVLVAQRDRTASQDVRTALESLELVNAPVIGTVLTTGTTAPWQ